jgi:hypothetical protein
VEIAKRGWKAASVFFAPSQCLRRGPFDIHLDEIDASQAQFGLQVVDRGQRGLDFLWGASPIVTKAVGA